MQRAPVCGHSGGISLRPGVKRGHIVPEDVLIEHRGSDLQRRNRGERERCAQHIAVAVPGIVVGDAAGNGAVVLDVAAIAPVKGAHPESKLGLNDVVDAVRGPVVAAGGISDGRGIAAVLALGAAGAQIGTAYLFCPEAATTPMHREALRHSRADATVLTNVFTGRPARAISNRLTSAVGSILDEIPDFPLAAGPLGALRAAAEKRGALDFTPLWSGQAAPLGRAMPARTLTVTLAHEALARW